MAWAVRAMTGNGRGRGVGLDPARRFPAVDDRQAHVHEDDIGRGRGGQIDALLAIDGDDDFVAPPREAAREHVAVHFVVFDEEDFGHGLEISS